MLALAKRVASQIAGDKRSAAMIVFAPLLIMTMLYFLLGESHYTPTIAVAENTPSMLVSALEGQDARIIALPVDTDAKVYLSAHKDVDIVFEMTANGTNITMYEATSKSQKAVKAVQGAMAALNPAAKTTTSTVIGTEGASFFNSMGYVFLGLFSFFIIFLISGMSLVKERTSGTMERFLMSPISRGSVIWGYTLGYGVFAVAQAVAMVLFGVYVLGITCAGNVAWAVLIMLLTAVSAVAFGSIISTVAATELQVIQFVPIAIIPQVFFSGLIPLDTIPYHLGYLGFLTPVFYGCAGLKAVMLEGGGLGEIWGYVLGLAAFIAALGLLNTVALKKYRKL